MIILTHYTGLEHHRFTNKAIAIALEPDGPHLLGFFPMVTAEGVNAIVQARPFQGVLVVDKLPDQ